MAKSTISYIDGTELEPREVTVSITDPFALKTLSKVPSDKEDEFIVKALSIGIVALDSATKQAEAIRLGDIGTEIKDYLSSFQDDMRKEVNDVMTNYFDPKSGVFEKRIDTLLKGSDGGELGRLLEEKLKGPEGPLQSSLNQFLGSESQFTKKLDPKNTEGVVQVMKEAIETAVEQQINGMVGQFDLNNEDGALARLTTSLKNNQNDLGGEIKDIFDLNNESSQLSVFKKTLFNEVNEMKDILNDFNEKIEKRFAIEGVEKNTTIGGKVFEDAVIEFITQNCSDGAFAEPVGAFAGAIPHSKTGDLVLTMGSDAVGAGRKIVVEIKNEKNKRYEAAVEELIIAKRNRKADIGVFVFSKQTAPEGMSNLIRNGKDIFVIWDNESNENDGYLEAALSLAKALIAQDQSHENNNYDAANTLDAAVQSLEQAVDNLDKISDSNRTIENQVTKINTFVGKAKRQVSLQTSALNGLIVSFKNN